MALSHQLKFSRYWLALTTWQHTVGITLEPLVCSASQLLSIVQIASIFMYGRVKTGGNHKLVSPK